MLKANRLGKPKVTILLLKSYGKCRIHKISPSRLRLKPSSVQTEQRIVDWEKIKRCLAEIDSKSPDFLRNTLLIGGAACWFYRRTLAKAEDPDFKVPVLAPEMEKLWLSRDIDFTGIFSEDALTKLPHNVVEENGRKFVVVEGVRLGFAQTGVVFDPEEALTNARTATISSGTKHIEFFVIDPVTLYLEKQKLYQTRNNPNDFLHLSLVGEYVKYELVRGAEQILTPRNTAAHAIKETYRQWYAAKTRAPEMLIDGPAPRSNPANN